MAIFIEGVVADHFMIGLFACNDVEDLPPPPCKRDANSWNVDVGGVYYITWTYMLLSIYRLLLRIWSAREIYGVDCACVCVSE